ncbi:hypothetical protein CY34DRAFT_259840 [Suillus luteus UH-Slu-Lm8-n1]|uniref:Uncharacterized protein n=1 Tax=Suillus luteus UH-Slu-Lm8-n1 TaxID=930992 RepID=A0A0D0B287_9AGAM|nr:hypothetical protein CY34DRAFT_259840 [Suillus luteus UH-Slu-Lm8-n1]
MPFKMVWTSHKQPTHTQFVIATTGSSTSNFPPMPHSKTSSRWTTGWVGRLGVSRLFYTVPSSSHDHCMALDQFKNDTHKICTHTKGFSHTLDQHSTHTIVYRCRDQA